MLLTTLLVKVISSLTQLIVAGGVADAEGTLAIGDVIISINGTTVKDILHKKLLELLTGKSTINLVIQRDSKTQWLRHCISYQLVPRYDLSSL